MKYWLVWVAATTPMVLVGFMLITYAKHMEQLPPRPPTGNHGQGQSPARGRCPSGTREFWVDAGEGEFFLECQR